MRFVAKCLAKRLEICTVALEVDLSPVVPSIWNRGNAASSSLCSSYFDLTCLSSPSSSCPDPRHNPGRTSLCSMFSVPVFCVSLLGLLPGISLRVLAGVSGASGRTRQCLPPSQPSRTSSEQMPSPSNESGAPFMNLPFIGP